MPEKSIPKNGGKLRDIEPCLPGYERKTEFCGAAFADGSLGDKILAEELHKNWGAIEAGLGAG